MTHDLHAALSEPRFRTYVSECRGDVDRAAALYVVNMRLSGAALESLHMFEVVLRNALDTQLRAWNNANGGSEFWTLAPVPLLRAILDARGTLQLAETAARNAVRKQKRELTHDDVVAQLSFGTWRYLLPSRRDLVKQKD